LVLEIDSAGLVPAEYVSAGMKPLPILALVAVLAACGGETPERTDPQGLPNPIPVVVWVDADLDGGIGPAEERLAGVVVRLVDPSRDDEVVDEAVTGGDGTAELVGLQDLIPGYAVVIAVPPGGVLDTSETFPMEGHDYRAEPVPFALVEAPDG